MTNMNINFDIKEFRNALGAFPTGVCVVTTLKNDQSPFGMTVNSFSSVSLDPALVLWSIQKDSECFSVFDKVDGFCINVLSEDQQTISNQYATRGEHELIEGQFEIGKSGLPIIKGAAAVFECSTWQRYPGGDHIILIGETSHFTHNANMKPLVFHSGKYGQVA